VLWIAPAAAPAPAEPPAMPAAGVPRTGDVVYMAPPL
jgi:hypothetical protein